MDIVSKTFVPNDEARRKPLDGNASPKPLVGRAPREGGMNFRPPLPLLGNIAVAAEPFVVASDVAKSLFFAVLVLLVSVLAAAAVVVLVVLVVLVVFMVLTVWMVLMVLFVLDVLVVFVVPAADLCVRFDFLVTCSPGLAKFVLTASISLVDKVDGFIIPVVSALTSFSSP